MNAKESMEAMVDAYLLPTIGLKYFFVISLLYLLMYAFEVVEIVSRSGNRVCWNLIGRSLISDTKSCSSSPSSSSQRGFCFVVCFCVLGGGFVFCEVGLVVLLFLSELGLILMMLSGSEEDFVLVLVEFFDELGLDIDFDVVEFSFLMMSSDFLERESSVVVLVEFVVVLRGLVWFFVVVDKLGLMSLVLFLLDEEETAAGVVVAVVVLDFFFGLFCFFSCSSSKSANIDLLPPPRIWFLL
ncbi:hypothetical protein LWI29_007447 [Acer saccharum]|uniref:Transmembrane protein n=1 Tax=Acer saccharum TaxID=4024 RepID=A0AA39SXU4_ACESA|nr:hypothetical protein LWI29_007447 [Acer saccharum]